ncbi:MAG: 4Fe-4S dicluster domain-containing protein [Gammaproteobacteria bacterium]
MTTPMPVRDTFGLLPDSTPVLLYAVFAPFAVALGLGLYWRFRALGLGALIAAGPGGVMAGVRRLLRYGLGQARVAQKPRGWPHLGIFYGFLTLLAGTTLVALDWDVFHPFGARLLQGNRYLYLEAVLDLLGAIFVASLATALVWRLAKLRAASADQRRIQWQFIALIAGLLYLGVTGFTLEGLRLAVNPQPWADWSWVGWQVSHLLPARTGDTTAQIVYIALWWSHALVAFTLLAALPYSTFLHSFAAPLNLLVHPGQPQIELATPFDLRELQASGNFDVKVGAASLADLDPRARFALMACTNCGRCENACPAFAMGTALSPRRLVQTLRWRYLQGDKNTDLLTGGAVTAAELWACTTCAACVEACPVLIRPVDYIVPFRRELVTRQQLDKKQTELLGNLGRSFNPYGLPASNRLQLARDLTARAGS